MAKTRWKSTSTSMASRKRGMAFIRDETMTLRPWIDEIVLRGRMTLKDLRA